MTQKVTRLLASEKTWVACSNTHSSGWTFHLGSHIPQLKKTCHVRDAAFPQETEELRPSLMEKSLSDRLGLKTRGQILPRNMAVGHYVPHTTVKVISVQGKQLTGQWRQFFKNCFLETRNLRVIGNSNSTSVLPQCQRQQKATDETSVPSTALTHGSSHACTASRKCFSKESDLAWKTCSHLQQIQTVKKFIFSC